MAFSVLKSFLRASQGNSKMNNENDGTETTSSGSTGYFSPGMDNSILAPYNFNFT